MKVLTGFSEDFAIDARRCDRWQSQGSDHLAEAFAFVVLELLVKLELLQSGCVSSINLVNAESSWLKEDKNALQIHRVQNLVYVRWCWWRVNRRFYGPSLRIEHQHRVVIESRHKALTSIAASVTDRCERFGQGRYWRLTDEEWLGQVRNLPDRDLVGSLWHHCERFVIEKA